MDESYLGAQADFDWSQKTRPPMGIDFSARFGRPAAIILLSAFECNCFFTQSPLSEETENK